MQGVSFAALAVSRALNIYPCSLAVNVLRPTGLRIPQSHQFVLWFSGLRGAMAFAIALEAAEAMPGGMCERVCATRPAGSGYGLPAQHSAGRGCTPWVTLMPVCRRTDALCAPSLVADERGELVLASTYCIVLATVLVNGGSCTWLLTRLGLRAAPLGAKSFRRWVPPQLPVTLSQTQHRSTHPFLLSAQTTPPRLCPSARLPLQRHWRRLQLQ
jgi:hypothetical protein